MDQKTPQGTPMPDADQLSGLLSGLLANPALMGRIRDLMASSSGTTEEKAADTSADNAEKPTSLPAGGLLGSDGLASILGNPDLMAKLPGIIAVLKPLLADLPLASSPAAPASAKESPKSVPVCRDNLLLALKPFLSPQRCDAIDSMIRIAKLGEILGHIK